MIRSMFLSLVAVVALGFVSDSSVVKAGDPFHRSHRSGWSHYPGVGSSHYRIPDYHHGYRSHYSRDWCPPRHHAVVPAVPYHRYGVPSGRSFYDHRGMSIYSPGFSLRIGF